MEETNALRITRQWLGAAVANSERSQDSLQAREWTIGNALIAQVPDSEVWALVTPQIQAVATPEIEQAEMASVDLLVLGADALFHCLFGEGRLGTATCVRRLAIQEFGSPAVIERRENDSGADRLYRHFRFPVAGEMIAFTGDRIANSSYEPDGEELLGLTLARALGWDISA